MRFIEIFQFRPLLDTILSFATAFVLGALIGAERQYRQRNAGLRTNILVAVGAAAFADLGMSLVQNEGAMRITMNIVTGIGFLGAGVIMKEGANIRGLNTAATLWATAAVGAFAGSDLLVEAAVLTVFILAGNTLMRPLVNLINRIPVDESQIEATYLVRVGTEPALVGHVREIMLEALEKARYPVAQTLIDDHGDDEVEIAAELGGTAVVAEELDALVATLEKQAGVRHATWDMRTDT